MPVEYPHTMQKGRFKGRTFQNQAEYQQALGASQSRVVGNPEEDYFHLIVVRHGQRMEVKGKPNSLIMDALLDALSRIDSAIERRQQDSIRDRVSQPPSRGAADA